jgi:hypothetical protein
VFPIHLFALSVATILFGSAVQASPLVSFEAPSSVFADLIVQSGSKCNFVNGKLVCDQAKKGAENKKRKVKEGDHDDDDRGKGKKGDDVEVTERTIQEPGGGGGCKAGFKRVCEKMKSGKKCCGCVPDKSAQPPAGERIEDHPCFVHCSSTKCGGATKEVRDACVLDCLQSTNCTRH